jgi:hypothetical protein
MEPKGVWPIWILGPMCSGSGIDRTKGGPKFPGYAIDDLSIPKLKGFSAAS